MKKCVFILVFTLILSSCTKVIDPAELALINGYWEIEKVETADGGKKDYKINEFIDFFELKGASGFRRKVRPQFDGTYEDTGLSESITVVSENGGTFLHYKTDYATWKEQIISVSNEKLVLKNDRKAEYHYKKHIPIRLK